MAINPSNGVLDIINGTLKVSSIDVKQAGGFSTVINTVARNNVLLFDDQKSTTSFMPTAAGGYKSSTGVTRNTSSGSRYLELGTASDAGWVYWPLQLPNSWHAEFDMHVTATGGVLTFSLYNTSEPNHTDYTNNDGGYKIVFDNTNNQIVIYWEGSVHKTVSIDLRSNDWQHVNVNYSQGATSVSLAGKVVLTHEFTENYQEFNSRYVGFSATAGTSHKIRHLRIHNGDKWLYTKTSNASDITYVSGNVGIGSLAPTELLDVHGNVHIAKDLTVDGNLRVSGTTTFIDTTNTSIEDPIIELAKGNTSDTIDAGLIMTRNTSNVAIAYRGDEDELAFGYTQSGASGTDVTPIANGGLDVRVYGNLFANNLTTTANVEAAYLKGDGSYLTGLVTDLQSVADNGNTCSNTIQLTNTDVGLKATGNVEANYFVGDGSKLTGLVTDLQSVADNGNTCSNTIQFTNATTAFIANSNVGIGTSSPSADLHVAGYQYVNGPPTLTNSFDHSDAPLTLTHGTATSSTAINDPKPVLHLTRSGTNNESYGARASFNLSRYENSSTHSRSRLDVTLTDGTYAESTVMTLRADGKVGVGTTSPAYTLDVGGDINIASGSNLKIGGTNAVFSNWTVNGSDIYRQSGNVGIGTNNPRWGLEVTPPAGKGGVLSCSDSAIFSHNLYYSGGWKYGAASKGGAYMRMIDSEIQFWNAPNSGSGTWDTAGGAATATQRMTIDESGNVGIGTASPQDLLHIYGVGDSTLRVETDTGQAQLLLRAGATTRRACRIDFSRADTGTQYMQIIGDYAQNATDDLTVASSTSGRIMTWLQNGNVGIGTTSPDTDLHIYGSTSQTNIFLGETGTPDKAGIIKYFQGDNSSNPGRLAFGSWGDNFSTGASTMCIKKGGFVGIGTNSPAAKLHIGPKDNDHIYLASSNNSYGWTIDTDDQGSGTVPFRIIKRTGGVDSTVLTIKNQDGNVGIGTTSPTQTLDVNGSVRQRGANTYLDWGERRIIMNYDNTYRQGIKFSTGTREMTLFSTTGDSGGSIIFKTRAGGGSSDTDYGTERMRITGGGNVGIGTTGPGYKLDVAGDINISSGSVFRINGTALANSATIAASVSAGNSTLVQRHSSGYIFANYFNTTPNDVTSGVTKVCVETGNDGYIRHGTSAAISTFLGLANSATIEATTADTANKIAQRNSSGDIFARLFRSDYQNQSTISGGIAYRVSTSDNYIRFCTDMGAVRTKIGCAAVAGSTSQNFSSKECYVQNWVRTKGNAGHYWESSSNGNGWHIYPKSRADMYFRSGSGSGGIAGTVANTTVRGYVYWNTSNQIGFLNKDRAWALRMNTDKNCTIFGGLELGTDGKDWGSMTASYSGNIRKNLWIQSTYNGNTSSNYGWWIGTQNQTLHAGDNDLHFICLRNGSATHNGYIQDGSYNAHMNFTGQHRTFVKDTPIQQLQDKEGLIVSADQDEYIRMSGGIAHGSDAITINESLPVVSLSTKSNDKKCFGVLSTTEDPEGRREVHGNFVSNFTKEKGDTRIYVNSVGEGAVWVTNINGNLESGDYITTSNVVGYGMKQDDDILHNYTVAKITMNCDFNPKTIPKKNIKKKLANVDYWVEYATIEITVEEYEALPENERKRGDEDNEDEDKYYKIYKKEIQIADPGDDKHVHEVHEEFVNVLDEHDQLQWEDDPSGATEKAYKIRYLDTDGNITDEANAVHIAAFVGCTYHCG